MNRAKNKGFIGIIILVIIGLVLLKYFLGWSIFEAAQTEDGQETIGYTRQIINTTWGYIQAPVTFVWDRIVWPILELSWKNFQVFLDWGHETAARAAKNQ